MADSREDDERNEDHQRPPGDIRGLVNGHGVAGVLLGCVHRAVRSDAVDLAGAPRSVALGQVGFADGGTLAAQDGIAGAARGVGFGLWRVWAQFRV